MPPVSTPISSALLASLMLGLSGLSCPAGERTFSVALKVEGRRVLVVGSNSLDLDLICSLKSELHFSPMRDGSMPEPSPPDASPSNSSPPGSSLPSSPLPGFAGGRQPDSVISEVHSYDLPRGSSDRIIMETWYPVDITAASGSWYGCRPKGPPLKDQTQHPKNTR